MIKNRSSECLVLLYIITIDNFVKIGRLITFPCWIMIKAKQNTRHCVKSVQILGFFWPVFSRIRHFWLAFSFYTLWKHNEILNEKLIPYMNTIRALFFNFSVESNNQRGEKSKNQLSKAKTKKKVSYTRLYVERYSRQRDEQGWKHQSKDSEISWRILNWYFRSYQT